MDLTIYETGNGGDLVLINNDLDVTIGIYNKIYLSLFGGNLQGSTSDVVLEGEKHLDYWGNTLFHSNDLNVQFNSRFEQALTQSVLTSAGLSTLENIASQDLSNLGNVSVSASLETVDRLKLSIVLTGSENASFLLIYDRLKNEVIIKRTI